MRFDGGALVNELTEAKHKSELNRVTNRWTRYELIVIDEMAYVAMPEQRLSCCSRSLPESGRAAVIITTICRSPSGPPCFRTHDCVRPCWTD